MGGGESVEKREDDGGERGGREKRGGRWGEREGKQTRWMGR